MIRGISDSVVIIVVGVGSVDMAQGFHHDPDPGYGPRPRGSEPVPLPRTFCYSAIAPAKFLHDLPEARIGFQGGRMTREGIQMWTAYRG